MALSCSLSIIFRYVLLFLDIKGPTAFQKALADNPGLHMDINNCLIAIRLITVILFDFCLYKSHLMGLFLSFKCLFFGILRLYIYTSLVYMFNAVLVGFIWVNTVFDS